jgi:hypothetical protein
MNFRSYTGKVLSLSHVVDGSDKVYQMDAPGSQRDS